jgi:hypothetical protein
VRRLPLEQKIQHLARLAPERVRGLEILVTSVLEDVWREEFHAGPRGGLKLKAREKGGA